MAELSFPGALWAGFLADARAAAAGNADALLGLAESRTALARLQVKRGFRCWVWTGHRDDLRAAGLVPASEPFPGDAGIGKAPRWVTRNDGRRCALSTNPRRKVGAHRVVLGMLADEVLLRDMTE